MTDFPAIFEKAAERIEREGHFRAGLGSKGTCLWLSIRQESLNANLTPDEDWKVRTTVFQHFNINPAIGVVDQIYSLNDTHSQRWVTDHLRQMATEVDAS